MGKTIQLTSDPKDIRAAGRSRRSSLLLDLAATQWKGPAAPKASHFLLYLNEETWRGDPGTRLAEEVRRVRLANEVSMLEAEVLVPSMLLVVSNWAWHMSE